MTTVNGFNISYSEPDDDNIKIDFIREDGKNCWIGDYKWFYYLKPANDDRSKRHAPALIEEYTDEIMKNGMIVYLTIADKRLFTWFPDYEHFLRYEAEFPDEFRGFFETIPGDSYQKPHFDIDIDLVKDDSILVSVPGKTVDEVIQDLLDSVITAIIGKFKEIGIDIDLRRDMLLFNSHGTKKRSFHIVIDNYYHENNKEAEAFYRLVISDVLPFFHRWIDPSVYKSLQQFRLEGSQKINSGRIKKLMTHWKYRGTIIEYRYSEPIENEVDARSLRFKSSLIRYTEDCYALPSFIDFLCGTQGVANKDYQIGNSFELSDDDVLNALELLEEKIKDQEFPYKLSKVERSLILLKRIRPSVCQICDRIHDNENPFLFIVGKERKVYFNCRRDESNRSMLIGSLLGKITDEEILYIPSQEEIDSFPVIIPTVDKNGKVINGKSHSINSTSTKIKETHDISKLSSANKLPGSTSKIITNNDSRGTVNISAFIKDTVIPFPIKRMKKIQRDMQNNTKNRIKSDNNEISSEILNDLKIFN